MGNLVFQATLGGQVNLVGPNTASTFNLNVPATSSTIATLTGTETFTNKTLTSPTLTSPNITTALTLTGAAGTSGQVLTSAGSGFAPTWTTVSAPSAATPTALGTVYGLNNTASPYNTFYGYQAGNGATLNTNVYVGYQAGYTGGNNDNVAIGYKALYTEGNTGNGSNVAIGAQASWVSTSSAYNNVAVGYRAGYSMTSGQGNTLIGNTAGRLLTTASNAVMIGQDAGTNLTTGNGGIYIGNGTNTSSGGNLGELVIGTTNGPTGKGQYTGYIFCNGSIYQGNNSSSWATTSDRRLKKNIVDNTQGLDVISQIRVRNFEYRTTEEVTELPAHTVIKEEGVKIGVIAQELREVLPKCVKEESTGVVSVDSDDIFWHMVNAVKDLKALNDTQAETINALTARIVALEAK